MTQPSPTGPPLRIVLAAGGTGGHLMPALAVAEALQQRIACEFLVVGAARESERALRGMVPFPVVELRVHGIAGSGPLRRLRSLAGLPPSILTASRHLGAFRPHLVIATGGYVCGPTGLAAYLRRIPLLVLEQNADPGLTTRWLRFFADSVGVSFARTARRLGSRAVITGNPIRGALPAALRRDGNPARTHTAAAVHLLIVGGSQGAQGLNTMVRLAIPLLAEADIGLRVTHQTGPRDVETMRSAWAQHGIPATVAPFISNIGDAYARADLVCARAGATTVAELTYCGLPSVLVPFPRAAARHQHANAVALVEQGATVMIEEAADGRPLAEAIIELASNPLTLATTAAAAAAMGRDDAADAVADIALELASRGAGTRVGEPDRGSANRIAEAK